MSPLGIVSATGPRSRPTPACPNPSRGKVSSEQLGGEKECEGLATPSPQRGRKGLSPAPGRQRISTGSFGLRLQLVDTDSQIAQAGQRLCRTAVPTRARPSKYGSFAPAGRTGTIVAMMDTGRNDGWRTRLPRLALLLPGMACLVAGIWGGLLRLPVSLPVPTDHANWITYHGPLMVCGFLGTVIALERAVGLRSAWTYAAPLCSAVGGALLLVGGSGSTAAILLTAASALFSLVTLRVVQLQRALFTSVMAAGAHAWLVGNLLWLSGRPLPRVVPWWMAFLALTIVGERLDLSRFQRPNRWARPLFSVALALFLVGVVTSSVREVAGIRLTGLGLLGLSAWLATFDLARKTVLQAGLTRFMAVCLLAGYFWMAVSGVLLVMAGPVEFGMRYDAALHAFFVGFVFSMIFGHAPVIFPAVLDLRPAYRPAFYAHVTILHAGLLLRVIGDWVESLPVRQWGGALNAAAVGLFLVNMIGSFLFPPASTDPRSRDRHPVPTSVRRDA
jgi:hypothetical protein